MAHTLSAKKRIRQNAKRRSINRWRKDRIKQAVRNFEDTLKSGDKTRMSEALQQAFKTLDQVAAKGTIHKNTAARKKQRLARAMNKAAS